MTFDLALRLEKGYSLGEKKVRKKEFAPGRSAAMRQRASFAGPDVNDIDIFISHSGSGRDDLKYFQGLLSALEATRINSIVRKGITDSWKASLESISVLTAMPSLENPEALPEVAYAPDEAVLHAYKEGHRRVYRSAFQRWLLSTRLSDAESVQRLQAAAYAGLDFYISNVLVASSGPTRLSDSQVQAAIAVIGRYLGNVSEESRKGIAGRVVFDLIEQLPGKKLDLLTATVSSSRSTLIVKLKQHMLNTMAGTPDSSYALAA